MAFFDEIELVPNESVKDAISVSIPGSKSITNRALILAALSPYKIRLVGALWSQDTQIMVSALEKLGFDIQIDSDSNEPCNRHITISGLEGSFRDGGTPENPLEIYVGNAGTAARFLLAFLCLGRGYYRLSGVERMHARPQKALIQSLRQLGYTIHTDNDFLPAVVLGEGKKCGKTKVSVSESSQFASALLLSASYGDWEIIIDTAASDHLPYVEMTKEMIHKFENISEEGDYFIEPDSSSASYFWGAGHLLGVPVSVRNWPKSNWQIDSRFPDCLPLKSVISREKDLGDSIMTAICMAPFNDKVITFTDLGRLRVQECERVEALRTELTNLGATIEEKGDTLIVQPSSGDMHGGYVQTYDDHRVAMAMSLVGLKIPGVKIVDPSCVRKTFPNFFSKWSESRPQGVGVMIKNPKTGQVISPDQLTVKN